MKITKNIFYSNTSEKQILNSYRNRQFLSKVITCELSRTFATATFFLASIFSPAYIFSLSPIKSEVKFQVTHPIKTVIGNCEKIEVNNFNAAITNEKLQIQNPFTVTVTVDGMTTANGNRDSNMYRVLGFPGIKTIEANIQKVTPIENNRYKISGNLKIKAKELPFTAEGIFSKEGDMYILQGSFSVMLSDYGVERPVLIVSIDNTVRIDFRIQLK